jgi:hypothetical protein
MNSSLSLFIYSNPCLCFHSKIDSDLPHTLQLLYPERPAGETQGRKGAKIMDGRRKAAREGRTTVFRCFAQGNEIFLIFRSKTAIW